MAHGSENRIVTHENLNRILTFSCYHYCDYGVARRDDFAEIRLPIVAASGFPVSFLFFLCSGVYVA
jgi:hypothetical protein